MDPLRDCYRRVLRIAKVADIPRHISPHSLRRAAITNALDAAVPLRDAQILAGHADPRTTSTTTAATWTATGCTSARPTSPACNRSRSAQVPLSSRVRAGPVRWHSRPGWPARSRRRSRSH
ncbi:MAG: tyrosine-type recombinase/integrase [Propionibacteriales bacterium]|nr:tyrosine-type recombinase/integrase [Propionibacteriales bacterium]